MRSVMGKKSTTRLDTSSSNHQFAVLVLIEDVTLFRFLSMAN